jgi:2-C-methyl-D-erythritol 4-phosphate cytidylyltransferase
MTPFSIIITAGGIGKRMGSSIPKQFIEIANLPLLMHTINCFYSFDSTCQIIVTLPEDWKDFWTELIKKHEFKVPHIVIDGGIERYDSIKNALTRCANEIVGVHDGVRPLVNHSTIGRCLKLVKEKGTAIPTLTLKESLRKINEGTTESVERKNYLSVQTPQFFTKKIIEKAYNIPFHSAITDDASLVEEAGFKIEITEGNEENIKVTTPFDLQIINLFIK